MSDDDIDIPRPAHRRDEPDRVPPVGLPLLSYATPVRRPPIDCPGCGRPLYLNPRLRPKPKLSAWGRVLVAFAVVVSSATLAGLLFLIRRKSAFDGLACVGPILVLVSVLPGLLLGYVAHRLPKVQTLRCAGCGWAGRFVLQST